MVFASVPFLFVFLPAVLAAYFLCPRRWHNAVLLVFSLFFYAWGEPVYILLMLSSITVSFLAGRALGRAHTPARRRAVLSASVAYHLLTLGFFKYADFLIGTVNSLFGLSLPLLSLPLPIGISFYTFQTLSYIVDVYRGVCAPQRRWDWLAMYVSLFPQLIAGPIVRYQTVEQQIAHRTVSRAQCAEGVRRFTAGLVKKVLLANNIGLVFTQILGNGALPQSVLAAWVAVAAYTFQIYFDFAGYSDMAIGLGKLFGFTFEENFNHAVSIAQHHGVLAQMAYFARHLVSAIMSTSRWAATAAAGAASFSTSPWYGCSPACGMAPAGISCCGARTTPCC